MTSEPSRGAPTIHIAKHTSPTALETPDSTRANNSFPSSIKSRKTAGTPCSFDFFAHKTPSGRSSVALESPHFPHHVPHSLRDLDSPHYPYRTSPPRSSPLPHELALDSLLSSAEPPNAVPPRSLESHNLYIHGAANWGLVQTGFVSWPLADVLEACLMRYFVENLTSWVMARSAKCQVRCQI